MPHVLAICGSLQARSGNLTLLQTAQRIPVPELTVTLFEGLRALPHFDPDLDTETPPEPVSAWREALRSSDGVLIACPEYGFSLPGALKNAIDWTIQSGELEGKVVATTAAVPTRERGRMGLQALHQTLTAVRAQIVWGEPIAKGPNLERDAAKMLEALMAQIRAPRPRFEVS